MSFELSKMILYAIVPQLVLVCGAICLLVVNIFKTHFSKSLNILITALFFVINIVFILRFGNAYVGGVQILTQLTISIAALILLALSSGRNGDISLLRAEYYPLYMLMCAGFEVMVTSSHLLIILLGLEIGSLSLCVLIALNEKDSSLEAGIKYFVMGILASVFIIFGMMGFYFLTNSLDLIIIASHIRESFMLAHMLITMVAMAFIVAGIGFKISAFGFHSWMPDVYEGSNAIMAGVVGIIPKIAAFGLAIYVFGIFKIDGYDLAIKREWLEFVLYALVVLTITLPNIAALMQDDIKRMLSFSSISHSGFVLACILIGSKMSLEALYLYWAMFLLTNIGVFGLLWFSENKAESSAQPFSKYHGLIRTSPMMAILLGIFMLSLAGIPPFGLFWGKLYVIMGAFWANYNYLAIIMMLNSAIAVVYYLKLIVAMFLKEPNAESMSALDSSVNASLHTKLLVGIMAVICCISIFMVQYLLDFISKYII